METVSIIEKAKMTDQKTKKESFVGPKEMDLYMKDFLEPIRVTFPTSINMNKSIKMAKGEVTGVMFSVWEGVERFSISSAEVQAFIFPKDQLTLRRLSKDFVIFTIFFDDETKFEIPIAGENRLRIVYKQLEDVVGKPIIDSNQWIVISQEENRFAHIRYNKKIVAMTSSKDQ